MIATLLNEIVAAGMSEAQIARLIGRNQSSVNRMRHGKQRPDFETGRKIELLHRNTVNRTADEPSQEAA